jgi:16S rRNA U516 pseudouridylate synthase RsuA-like enzyme
MIASFNNRVVYLERIRFADITLDASLARGEFRPLTDSEIKSLENKALRSI